MQEERGAPTERWLDRLVELVKIQLLDKAQEMNEEGWAPEATQFVGDLADNERILKTAAKAWPPRPGQD